MFKFIFKKLQTALIIILMIIATILIFASLKSDDSNIDYLNNNQFISSYSTDEEIIEEETTSGNALYVSDQVRNENQYNYGMDPLLLNDGRSLWYSAKNYEHAWELRDPEMNTIQNGYTNVRILKVIQLENGNLFGIEDKTKWFVWDSVDGHLIDSGENGGRENREVMQMSNGTIVLMGQSGTWQSIVEVSPGDYEVVLKSSDAGSSTMYAYDVVEAEHLDGDYIAFANINGGIGLAEFDTETNRVNKITIRYLDQSHGSDWENTSKVVQMIRLSNGNYVVTSDSGEYSIIGYEDNKKINILNFAAPFKGNTNPDIYSVIEINEKIYGFSFDKEYFVSDLNGEILYQGKIVDDIGCIQGILQLNDGSVWVGGEWNEYRISEAYSFANDIVDLAQTKLNILTYTDIDGNSIYTSSSTYAQVETALRESIVSEYIMPTDPEFADITLYDEVIGTDEENPELVEVVDLNRTWNSDEIHFSVATTNSDPRIIDQTELFTIDLEFSVAINSLTPTYVSQTRAQIDYEFFIPDTNPIVSVNLLKDDQIIATDEDPIRDEAAPAIVNGSFIIDDLEFDTLYEGYRLEIRYKQTIDSLLPIITTEKLEGSTLESFKTLNDELIIYKNRIIAETSDTGVWYTTDPITGYSEAKLKYSVYDDGSTTYTPSKTTATIKEVDSYDVVTEKEVFIEATDSVDNPDTIVTECEAIINFKIVDDAWYTNLELFMNGDSDTAISVPVYNELGQVLIHSRAPEEVANPNHFTFLIVIIIIVVILILITVIAGVVIYKKHHFHH